MNKGLIYFLFNLKSVAIKYLICFKIKCKIKIFIFYFYVKQIEI